MSVVKKNLILDFEMAKRKRIVLSIEEKLKVCEMFRNKIHYYFITLFDVEPRLSFGAFESASCCVVLV